jgi:hypothetical protein
MLVGLGFGEVVHGEGRWEMIFFEEDAHADPRRLR